MTKKQSKATQQANMQRASERAAAIRAEQDRKERRTRTLLVTAAVVAVLLIVTVIGYIVMSERDTTGQAATPPNGAVDTYSVAMGADDAPVTVTVYEDFMCPYCGLFEQVSAERLKKYADSGDVQVRYHVVSFLDQASSSDYSTRAANALAVVLDTAGPEVAVKFHDALFANQPEEGSAGLSDEELVDLAVEAGADQATIEGPIADLKFEQWVVNSTDEWSRRGFKGTPTVTVNDEKVDFNSAEELLANTEQAIEDALAE
jgi:protein-disulfide isomerase